MRICLGCRAAHIKCQSRGEGHPCSRCFKYHFQCIFPPSPPVQSIPPSPPPPILLLPKCTHQYNAITNSSNRVKAAAVAFLMKQPNHFIAKSRISDSVLKKKLKQDKFLKPFSGFIGTSGTLSPADIKRDIIVFDGTASDPPPSIYPPYTVSNILFILLQLF